MTDVIADTENPYAHPERQPTTSKPAKETPGPTQLVSALVFAVFLAIAGGIGCGIAIDYAGSMGSILVWVLGAVGGEIARKILGGPSRIVAVALVLACVIAIVIGETYWIYHNLRNAEDNWAKAFFLLPTFVDEFRQPALIAALCTGFGAYSAYRRVAYRYRFVAVVER